MISCRNPNRNSFAVASHIADLACQSRSLEQNIVRLCDSIHPKFPLVSNLIDSSRLCFFYNPPASFCTRPLIFPLRYTNSRRIPLNKSPYFFVNFLIRKLKKKHVSIMMYKNYILRIYEMRVL